MLISSEGASAETVDEAAKCANSFCSLNFASLSLFDLLKEERNSALFAV